MRELKRSISRRVGKLVFKITPEGIELRGYRKRSRRKLVTWAQIAGLADAALPIVVADEESIGKSQLQKMDADPTSDQVDQSLCAAQLWNSGKRSPRSCKVCKHGPCKFGIERKPAPKPFTLEGA